MVKQQKPRMRQSTFRLDDTTDRMLIDLVAAKRASGATKAGRSDVIRELIRLAWQNLRSIKRKG